MIADLNFNLSIMSQSGLGFMMREQYFFFSENNFVPSPCTLLQKIMNCNTESNIAAPVTREEVPFTQVRIYVLNHDCAVVYNI